MSESNTPAMGRVGQDSARYANATTELSKWILHAEEYLNSLPGKREVSIAMGTGMDAGTLKFKRGKDGRWFIFYSCSPMASMLANIGKKDVPEEVRLADAAVNIKLACAPFMEGLLKALCDDLVANAIRAENAVAAMRSVLTARKTGGA